MDDIKDDRPAVYEIGYLIVSSVPEEKVPESVDQIRKIVNDGGGSIIAEEMPKREDLAYTMRIKTVSGAYEKYDQAYFGWIKFEVGSNRIEAVKKALETLPFMLRMLLITTVRENTYLGKRSASPLAKVQPQIEEKVEEKKEVAPASIEEMDKSIDAMVKEV
jgi:ribosomal protein S6